MNYYEKAREFKHDYELYSYQSLKDVRDQLLKDLLNYESGDPNYIPIDEDMPTAQEQYLLDLLYAKHVFDLLYSAYKKEILNHPATEARSEWK